MRLNGWVRIGLIASVAWIFIGGYLGNASVIDQARDAVATKSRNCNLYPDGAAPRNSRAECDRQVTAAWDSAVKYHWEAAAVVALVPIPVAWLLVWGLVSLVRWVRAGFATRGEL